MRKAFSQDIYILYAKMAERPTKRIVLKDSKHKGNLTYSKPKQHILDTSAYSKGDSEDTFTVDMDDVRDRLRRLRDNRHQ